MTPGGTADSLGISHFQILDKTIRVKLAEKTNLLFAVSSKDQTSSSAFELVLEQFTGCPPFWLGWTVCGEGDVFTQDTPSQLQTAVV